MKLKLDENLPHDLAAALATRGHDVHTVIDEHLAGQTDPVVVRAAAAEDRMVLTLDRGVGDLRHYPPGSHAGIVVLRPASQDPATIQHLVERLPCRHSHWTGCVGASPSSNLSASASAAPTKPGQRDPRR